MKKKIEKKSLMCLSSAILVAGLLSNVSNVSANATTDENLNEYTLDPVVVTATKIETKLLHTSADVSVITAKDIERMHYKSITAALETVPNVQILNYTNAYSRNKILINGDHHVVVLLNGVRVSQTDMGTLSMNYGLNLVRDMDNIKRIEVLKGAASVAYGSDAKGGVINIITKKPVKTKTTIKSEVGNFGNKKFAISHNQVIDDKKAIDVWAQKSKSGDYTDGAGKVWHSSDDNKSYGFTYNQRVGKENSGEITINFDKTTDNYMFQDGGKRFKQYILSRQDQKTLQMVYDQDFDKGWKNKLTYNKTNTKDKFTQYNVKKDVVDFSNPADWGTDNLSTQVVNDTLTKVFDENNSLILGFEKTKARDYNRVNGKATVNSYFAQYSWKMQKNWHLLAGYRHDKFDNSNGKSFRGNNSKSFTLTHDFDENTNVYGAYNEFFRAPEAQFLYGSNKFSNPELVPEIGKNRELGINHMTKDGTLINAHYFNRSSQNAVGWSTKARNKGEHPHYVNVAEKAHGFDINVSKVFSDKWSAKAGYAHLYVLDGGNYNKGYLPRNTFTVETTYKYKKVEAGFNARAFIGRTGQNVNYKGWPSGHYWVANLSANYKPTDDVKVYLKVNNLFNRLYAYHTDVIWNGGPTDWYSMPGRNIGLGVQYSF